MVGRGIWRFVVIFVHFTPQKVWNQGTNLLDLFKQLTRPSDPVKVTVTSLILKDFLVV